ncbi:MAG: alpha/beta hydrolase [Nakamurella sp.]
MKVRARLIETSIPADPAGVVLVLHGGGSRQGNMMVSPTQLSVLRMIPIARRIARQGHGELAVFRLLNSVRGWDSKHTPVDDALWAMQQIRRRMGTDLPMCLVGHSMGGRAAILAAGAAPVHSAVALAPWVYPTDGDIDLGGRKVLIVHGSADRIARATNSLAVARTLTRTAEVGYIRIDGGKHAMLRHHRQFDGYTSEFALSTLTSHAPTGPVQRVLDGEFLVQV